jgi:formylglycine-generating enzyme required for sulfatase activity
VPDIVAAMEGYRRWTDPLLRQAYREAEAGGNARKQLHASLALLPVERDQSGYLYGRLLDARPHEVAVIRDALDPYRTELVDRLWAVAERPEKGKEEQRLRAAAALARYDPDGRRWDQSCCLVAEDLVSVNAVYLGLWSEALRPVRASLLLPLSGIFRDRRPERTAERTLATNLLADYAGDRPEILADLLMDADEKQFAVLYPKFQAHGDRGLGILTGEAGRKVPPEATEADKETLAKRQANAVVALLKMHWPAKVWPLLKHSPDPRARSYLIHRLGPLGAEAGAIIMRLDEESDVSIRRALLLSLGEYGENDLPPRERDALLPRLFGLYRDEPDAGLHGAAEWLLLRWGQHDKLKEMEGEWREDGEDTRTKREARLGRIRQAITKGTDQGQWYVNGQGQTMVVIPGPITFQMGSPPTEDGREGGAAGKVEMRHEKRIGRSFAIAAREVTVEQFLRFRKDQFYDRVYSPTGDCPVNSVTWYEAAAYCNWLSDREGIARDQWCYLPNEHEKYAEGMKLAPGYLHRTGYRLPTEAEWEFACRAGSVTSRHYGESEALLGQYAWYTKNSLDRGMLPGVPGQFGVPGGRLKPNDLGLFDMLGNALEWCQDESGDYQAGEDVEVGSEIKDKNIRVLRGGSLSSQSMNVRSAVRDSFVPTFPYIYLGLRPARTFR